MKHHRGELKTSVRQQAVLKATRKGQWYSAGDLFHLTGRSNPAEIISALRLNGVPIKKRNRTTKDGRRFAEWAIG